MVIAFGSPNTVPADLKPVLAIRARRKRARDAHRDRLIAGRLRPAFAPMRDRGQLRAEQEEPTWEDAEWQ